jgi:hypothetical protein
VSCFGYGLTYSCARLRIHDNLIIQCTLRFGFVDLSLYHISVQPGLVLVLHCISSPCSLIYFRSVLAACFACFGRAFHYLVSLLYFRIVPAVFTLDVHFCTLFLAMFQICPGSIVFWTCISFSCSLLYFRFVLAVLCFKRAFLYLFPCHISDLS